MKTCRCHS